MCLNSKRGSHWKTVMHILKLNLLNIDTPTNENSTPTSHGTLKCFMILSGRDASTRCNFNTI